MKHWTRGVMNLAAAVLCTGGMTSRCQELPTDIKTRKHENWGYNAPDWAVDVPNRAPIQPGEHPRLVFRKPDLAALKKRAETAEGKVMIGRLNKLLDDKFTLWHPAGNGMLFQLTGDKRYAEKAKEQVLEILDKKRKDERDGRYGFYNGGGDMRTGPAISAMGLAYDLNYGGWDEAFRQRVAAAIQDHPGTAKISAKGPIMPSCNHYGAAVGGVGVGLLSIRGDAGVDPKKVEDFLGKIVKEARDEISIGYGDRGYYFEGHQCGRISSNTGLIPFVQAYRVAAGKDLVAKKDNARWLSAKWIYEFALNPDKTYISPQRGMYCRSFPRGGMWSQNSDFCIGFAITPAEYIPALKWVYNHQVEPGQKTYDILEYPHQAVYALAHWPLDVPEKNPQDQPDLFPPVLHDTAAGYIIFRNGWSDSGKDLCVSALLGTHPTHQNGRGMAAGGSVYVYGKGFGAGLDWPSAAGQRFPGIFYSSYPVYTKFEKDGSGVLSALRYAELPDMKGLNPKDASEAKKVPTSLAVDFSGVCGADLLVAMAGPQVGWTINQWLESPTPAKSMDLTGQDGYTTKTVEVKLGGQKAFVMTLQKGSPPEVKQAGETVTVGRRNLSFDGVKIGMGP
jgi:hypothetical protein